VIEATHQSEGSLSNATDLIGSARMAGAVASLGAATRTTIRAGARISTSVPDDTADRKPDTTSEPLVKEPGDIPERNVILPAARATRASAPGRISARRT